MYGNIREDPLAGGPSLGILGFGQAPKLHGRVRLKCNLVDCDAEAMALNETDRGWIKNTIAEALKEHFKGWKEVLRIWSIPSISIAILLFAFTNWDKYVEFRTHTSDRLDTIELQLRNLRASQSPGPVIKELGALSQKDFAKSLTALDIVVQKPVSEVNPEPSVLREINTRLLATPQSSPGYWPTVFRYIEFASSSVSKDLAPPHGSIVNLTLSDVVSRGPNTQEFSNQVIVLGGGSAEGLRFENCRILFTAEPIKMRNLLFVNCVFEFPVVSNPNSYLMLASRDLLSTDFKNVLMSIS